MCARLRALLRANDYWHYNDYYYPIWPYLTLFGLLELLLKGPLTPGEPPGTKLSARSGRLCDLHGVALAECAAIFSVDAQGRMSPEKGQGIYLKNTILCCLGYV